MHQPLDIIDVLDIDKISEQFFENIKKGADEINKPTIDSYIREIQEVEALVFTTIYEINGEDGHGIPIELNNLLYATIIIDDIVREHLGLPYNGEDDVLDERADLVTSVILDKVWKNLTDKRKVRNLPTISRERIRSINH